jgi:hypothetical protein
MLVVLLTSDVTSENRIEECGAAGLAMFTPKSAGAWHKGACFNFLPSFGGAFYTKSARHPPGDVSHSNI